jgi:cytochrome oxidase Cu insertion factor (SCO1/SenC/PrrC family)
MAEPYSYTTCSNVSKAVLPNISNVIQKQKNHQKGGKVKCLLKV